MKLDRLAALLVVAVAVWQFADLLCSIVAMSVGVGIVLWASRLPGADKWRARQMRWMGQFL